MSTKSGISGVVNKDDAVVGCTQEWSIEHGSDSTEYGASCLKQGTNREDGVTDWTGSWKALGGIPAVFPGDLFKFEGSVDGTVNGWASGANETICEGVTIDCDIEGGGIITHDVAFASNGTLTPGTVTVAADTTLPPVDLSALILNAIEQGTEAASPVYTTIENIRNWQLSITRANTAFSSSTTNRQTHRDVGRLDFEFTFSLYEAIQEDFLQSGVVRAIRAYVSATKFWDLKWLRFGKITEISSNQADPNIISGTQTGRMHAFATIAGVRTEGVIIDPTPTTKWPA